MGFGMALAKNTDAMAVFSNLSIEKQQDIIDKTHCINSKKRNAELCKQPEQKSNLINGGDFTEDEYLCLSDLLDQNLSGQEYFNTLPDKVRKKLLNNDDIRTFAELQDKAAEFSRQLNL